MIYPNTFEQKIGFDKVRASVEKYCITRIAKTMLTDANFSDNYDFVCLALRQTNEMRTILLLDDSFPDCIYVDIVDYLKKIIVPGTYMLAAELLDLSKALHSAKNIVDWLNKCSDEKYPELKKLAGSVSIFPAVASKLDDTVNKFAQVRDNASPELAAIRSNITSCQSQVSKRIQAIFKSAQGMGIVAEDGTISVRDGCPVIPVNVADKRKLKGLVIDESTTGKTAYIEPIEIVELNNEIKTLEYEERREVVKILVAVADFVRPYIDDLLNIGRFIGFFDFLRAKAKFALDVEAVMPIVENAPQLGFRKARHPLLMKALQKENKQIVPLDLNIGRDKHLLLISGPNAGGKSVCLKTVGLLQYMLQCGFLVSASENSEFGIFSDIFIDIGDEQSIENDLSTYSSHLLNMKTMLKNADNKSLVLIDEFGSGTEPAIGGAIAEAILTQFTEKRVFGVITTHYTNLKNFATNHDGIANGAMLFDTQKIEPLFKLEVGIPGSSFAFEIARKIGLPENILQNAQEKLGDNQVNLEKTLREIARNRRYWEEKRERVRKADKYLEELTTKYEGELQKLKEERKQILAKAKTDAAEMLANTNKAIENTIRKIRETQAQKDETRNARKQLDDFKQQILESDSQLENDKINRKIETLKQRQQRRAERKNLKTDDVEIANEPTILPIEIGAKVRIKGQSAIGEVVKMSGKNILINYGNIITTINVDNVEAVSNNEYRRSNRETHSLQPRQGVDLNVRRLNFKPDIDVRGMRTEEALPLIESFVDEAMMLGVSEIKILHGKGSGILKTQIRNMLKGIVGIKFIGDEHEDFGGAGITVIKMD